MATNAYFGFPSRASQFTLSGGNWLATYPLQQLQTLPLSYVARTLDATTGSTVIVATANSPASASVVALVRHNLSQSATIRVRTWTDVAGTTGLVDSGSMNVWPASYSARNLLGAAWTWFYRFADPGPATVGKIQLDISDTSNTDGYIQAGFLEIASAFDATYNFAFGSQYGFEWRSLLTEAVGGAEYVERRDHPRLFKGTFEASPRSESMGSFYEMQRQLGFDVPVLFVPLPAETTHLLRTVMFARQTDPGLTTIRGRYAGLSGASGIVDSVPMALREIIG